VRLDAIGDVLMTTPALRALSEACPGRRLTLLTSPAGAAAAALVPELDESIAYEAPWVKASTERGAEADQRMIERLRRGRYDAAVIFTVYSQSPLPAALLCHLAGVPLRLAHCRENPYQLLTDRVAESEPEGEVRHEVRRQLDLVAAIGAKASDERLSLAVPAAARERVRGILAAEGLEGERSWVLVHPGATAPSRRYPPESYAAAAGCLVRDHGCRVVFSGDASEAPIVESIRHAMGAPSSSLAGRLDLPGLVALVAEAPLLVVGNTGPVHVAAATGTPVVDLYALTNPQHTPWRVPSRVLSHDVPCRWCYKSVCPEGHHQCLRLVEPRQVVEAVLDLLAESGARTPLAGTAR
jgi:lipopolysaccharide heptosyltransferase II